MSPITTEFLLSRHGCPCPYCSRTMDVHSTDLRPTREHVQPKSRFQGSDILVVCSKCNRLKGDKTISEFVSFLVDKNLEFEQTKEENKQRLACLEYLIKMGLA